MAAGSEAAGEDEDVRFILLWIGFNAAYAGDVSLALGSESQRERDVFMRFFTTLVGFDNKHRIYDMVWQRFPQEIRVLLDNRYVFAPFWHHHNGMVGFADWQDKLERERVAIGAALRRQDTATILSILFGRLYVLRNQLVHGGAMHTGLAAQVNSPLGSPGRDAKSDRRCSIVGPDNVQETHGRVSGHGPSRFNRLHRQNSPLLACSFAIIHASDAQDFLDGLYVAIPCVLVGLPKQHLAKRQMLVTAI